MKKIFLICIAITFILSIRLNAQKPEPLAAYKIDSLWYFIDSEGKAIFNPLNILYVSGYSEGFYNVFAQAEGEKFWAFLSDEGQMAVPMCDDIRFFRDGMAMIVDVVEPDSEMRLYGYVDKQGRMIVPKKYLDAIDYSEGLAWVMNREERGYINKQGRMVIPWDTSGFGSQFSDGLAAMTNEKDRFGFINHKGETVIDYKYDEVTSFVNGYAKFNHFAKWGFIDKSGREVVAPKYDYALDFHDEFCFVGIPDTNTLNPMWGVINRGGGEVVDFIYDDVRDFRDGLGAVEKNGVWKFIDYYGNQVVQQTFKNCDSFRNGLAWVDDGEKTGFINPLGEFVYLIPNEASIVIDLRLNKKVK